MRVDCPLHFTLIADSTTRVQRWLGPTLIILLSCFCIPPSFISFLPFIFLPRVSSPCPPSSRCLPLFSSPSLRLPSYYSALHLSEGPPCRKAFFLQVRFSTSIPVANFLIKALDPVQSVNDLSWPSSFYSRYRSKFKPNLYVEVYVDQKQVGRSKTAKKTLEPRWSKTVTVYVRRLDETKRLIDTPRRSSAQESSELIMRLKHQSALPSDTCFGTVKTTVGKLLRLSEGLEGMIV